MGGVTFSACPATVSVPTGDLNVSISTNFTVPSSVNVVMVTCDGPYPIRYIGVTPQKRYNLALSIKGQGFPPYPEYTLSRLEHITGSKGIVWQLAFSDNYNISWSPEINKQTPTITDY